MCCFVNGPVYDALSQSNPSLLRSGDLVSSVLLNMYCFLCVACKTSSSRRAVGLAEENSFKTNSTEV